MKVQVTASGCLECRNKHGEIHRDDDLPAKLTPKGIKNWVFEGRLHRKGNPAIIGNGWQEWWEHGKFMGGDTLWRRK